MWLQRVVPLMGILLLSQRTSAQLEAAPRYHLISGPRTWSEAQSFCRLKYTDLATVNDMGDNLVLTNTLGSGVTRSWIGLQEGNTSRWMWSDGSGGVRFTNWTGGEPSNSGSGWCGDMSQSGAWTAAPCGQQSSFVCYDRQGGYIVLYPGGLSWVNSQELCRSHYTDLVSVVDNGDKTWVANFAASTVWIGLFNDAWMWSDGGETSFRYWLSGEPQSGACASVSVPQQGRWAAADCGEEAAFVCEGGLKTRKMVIRMKVRSGVDLTDSTVSDALLQTLQTHLNQQQVTDVTLSWQRLVFQP